MIFADQDSWSQLQTLLQAITLALTCAHYACTHSNTHTHLPHTHNSTTHTHNSTTHTHATQPHTHTQLKHTHTHTHTHTQTHPSLYRSHCGCEAGQWWSFFHARSCWNPPQWHLGYCLWWPFRSTRRPSHLQPAWICWRGKILYMVYCGIL